MFANLITLAHFSVSSAIRFPNSAGVIDSVSPPLGIPVYLGGFSGGKVHVIVDDIESNLKFLGIPVSFTDATLAMSGVRADATSGAKPAEGRWTMIRELGSDQRMPGSPAASKSEPIDAA